MLFNYLKNNNKKIQKLKHNCALRESTIWFNSQVVVYLFVWYDADLTVLIIVRLKLKKCLQSSCTRKLHTTPVIYYKPVQLSKSCQYY